MSDDWLTQARDAADEVVENVTLLRREYDRGYFQGQVDAAQGMMETEARIEIMASDRDRWQMETEEANELLGEARARAERAEAQRDALASAVRRTARDTRDVPSHLVKQVERIMSPDWTPGGAA